MLGRAAVVAKKIIDDSKMSCGTQTCEAAYICGLTADQVTEAESAGLTVYDDNCICTTTFNDGTLITSENYSYLNPPATCWQGAEIAS